MLVKLIRERVILKNLCNPEMGTRGLNFGEELRKNAGPFELGLRSMEIGKLEKSEKEDEVGLQFIEFENEEGMT